MSGERRPTMAVWKFASCDGCQLTLLDCEDELLPLAGQLDIRYFLEATSAAGPGPYDLSLVEGSVTTPQDAERIQHIRSVSRHLVTIGACATAGGIQALRDFADVEEYLSIVYAQPAYIDTLAHSTAISRNVPVDFELRGCPIDRGQLIEVITAFLSGRRPHIPDHSVCFACKRRGVVCLPVANGTPCLGPVTHAGCGALCPAYGRGCYGCFGPSASVNMPAFIPLLHRDGMSDTDVTRVLRTFNATAPEFADASGAPPGPPAQPEAPDPPEES
ncbi:NADH-quinone oxidoreductase subunit B family protein [Streptomyces xiamenensis]|uniref:NADH-quinone oxidoreductase subunit B family protein n=1 Tax=Streptomyces xiamenensis TaxID=408015 RepID=UPI0035E08FBF